MYSPSSSYPNYEITSRSSPNDDIMEIKLNKKESKKRREIMEILNDEWNIVFIF